MPIDIAKPSAFRLHVFAALLFSVFSLEASPARISFYTPQSEVVVDEPFTITLTIDIDALDGVHRDTQPLLPADPPHLDTPFLEPDIPSGLQGPDIRAWLQERLVGRRQSQGFAINRYTVRHDAFTAPFAFDFDALRRPSKALFRLPAERVKHLGRDIWRFRVEHTFTARAAGTYHFGPATLKGRVITYADAAGQARTTPVSVNAAALTVRVKPLPTDNRPASFVGVLGRDLSVRGNLDTQVCRIGEPLQLTLEVTGEFDPVFLHPPRMERQSDLTEQFRVYGSATQTEVLANGKRFRFRLRPLVVGTQEFPPVDVSYYDLDKREYVTLQSAPIPIQVLPSPVLTIKPHPDVRDSSTDGQTLAMAHHHPSALRYRLDADKGSTSLPPAWVWLIGAAVPLLVVVLQNIAKLLPGVANRRKRLAVARELHHRMNANNSPAGLQPALRQYLSVSWGLPAGAFTPADVEHRLRAEQLPEPLVLAWRDLVQTCAADAYRPPDDTYKEHSSPPEDRQRVSTATWQRLLRDTEEHSKRKNRARKGSHAA